MLDCGCLRARRKILAPEPLRVIVTLGRKSKSPGRSSGRKHGADPVRANFGQRPGQVGFSDFQIIRADGSDVRETVSQGASHPAVKRTL